MVRVGQGMLFAPLFLMESGGFCDAPLNVIRTCQLQKLPLLLRTLTATRVSGPCADSLDTCFGSYCQ
jgi:hypothetical protein